MYAYSARHRRQRRHRRVRLGPQYAVAADGRFLLNVVANEAAVSPITLILNWTALLPASCGQGGRGFR